MGQGIQEWIKSNVKFFKVCLSQILLGPFLNTLSHMLSKISVMIFTISRNTDFKIKKLQFIKFLSL